MINKLNKLSTPTPSALVEYKLLEIIYKVIKKEQREQKRQTKN